MSARAASRLAYACLALALALVAAGAAVLALNRASGPPDDILSFSTTFQTIAVTIAFAAVGALVASRRPGNAIGWLFLGFALVSGLYWLAGQYAYHALLARPGSLPGGLAVATALNSGFVPSLAVLTFIVLLFPTGRLPSRRWLGIAWVACASYAVLLAGATVVSERLDTPFESIRNPAFIAQSLLSTIIILSGVAGGILSVVAAFAAVVVRFRRGRSDERAQLKWFVSVAALVPVFLVAHTIADFSAPGAIGTIETLSTLVVAAFPVATGFAVLLYRLYEIDRILSRAVAYGALSALLAGTYFGVVLALQQIFAPITQGSELAVAGSTLAVAALFRPARRRVQTLVDRRFYRSKVDAERTLEAFTSRLRREIDLDSLTGELSAAVQKTMQPAHTSLWLRTPEAER